MPGVLDSHYAQETVPPRHIHIEPSAGWMSLDLGDLWEYRELLYFLAWRDVKVRYKQRLVGGAGGLRRCPVG
jgi:hypothetical protein